MKKDKLNEAIATGFPELDTRLDGGIHSKDLVLLAYRPGNAFEWFYPRLALNVAEQFQKRRTKEVVLILSLWCGAKELQEHLSKINPKWEKNMDIIVSDRIPFGTPDEIGDYIKFLGKELKRKIGLVIIHSLDAVTDKDNMYGNNGEILQEFKEFTENENTPIIISHVLPTDVEIYGRQDIGFPPYFHFFRNIRHGLYSCDIILALNRPYYYEKVQNSKKYSESLNCDKRLNIFCHKNAYGKKFIQRIECDDPTDIP